MPAQTPALRRFSASSGPEASTCRYGSAPRGRTLLDEMKSTSSHSASPTALWGGIPGAQACRLEVSADEIDERVHVFRLNGVGRHARDSVHAVFSWQMSVSVQPCTAIRPMMPSGKGRASRKAHSVEEAGGISRWRGEQRFCLHLRSAVLAAADLDRAVVVQNTERRGTERCRVPSMDFGWAAGRIAPVDLRQPRIRGRNPVRFTTTRTTAGGNELYLCGPLSLVRVRQGALKIISVGQWDRR